MKMPSRLRLAGALAAVSLPALGGCGGPSPPPAPLGRCPVLPGEVDDRDAALVFALPDDVDPARLPWPRTDGEGVVFRHFYEGLTDLGCDGEAVPALAEEWSTPDSVTWTFRLRPALFADGTEVRAEDVRDAWRRTRRLSRGDPARFPAWEPIRLRDVTTEERTVRIRLAFPDPDLPVRLADPAFVVARVADEGGWPLGTRGLAVQEREDGGRRILSGRPVERRPRANPSVRFLIVPGADPRDILEDDVDLLLARDRAALEQLGRRGDVRLTPLPWTRVYAFRDPEGDPPAPGPVKELRVELARDVLTSVARGADSLDPDGIGPADGEDDGGAYLPRGGGPILYPLDDPDAERVAERIASRRTRLGPFVSVQGVTEAELAARAGRGDGGGFVLVGRRGVGPFDWPGPPGTPPPVPLVKTRAVLVSRVDVAGIGVGGDGVPRLEEAGTVRERWR